MNLGMCKHTDELGRYAAQRCLKLVGTAVCPFCDEQSDLLIDARGGAHGDYIAPEEVARRIWTCPDCHRVWGRDEAEERQTWDVLVSGPRCFGCRSWLAGRPDMREQVHRDVEK